MNETSAVTSVTIFGRTYRLRSGSDDPDYLQKLAATVDERMHQLVRATGTADTLKVAILAALNLADDALQGRAEGAPRIGGEDLERLERLSDELEEVLARVESPAADHSPPPHPRLGS